MRLKKDSNSYGASSVIRREVRQDRPSDTHKPMAGKKDRKRWCGGHVGREHQTVCRNYRDIKNTAGTRPNMPTLYSGWRVLVCLVCGKELETYYGSVTKPSWITD